MDELGRVVIPKGIREALGWGEGTKLEIAIGDITARSVVAREAWAHCSLCRAQSEDLLAVEKGYVCPSCAAKIM